MALVSQNYKTVGVLLLLGVLAIVAVYFVQRKNLEKLDMAPKASMPESDYLALKAENVLLKKMLGQIQGDVVVLGPVGSEDDARGKLVWDKAMQGGFLHLQGLSASLHTYSLWTGEDSEHLVACGTFTPDDSNQIQTAFKASSPVYKPHVFLVTQGTDKSFVLVKGMLP